MDETRVDLTSGDPGEIQIAESLAFLDINPRKFRGDNAAPSCTHLERHSFRLGKGAAYDGIDCHESEISGCRWKEQRRPLVSPFQTLL
jgi:hypothetical protein